MNEPYAVCSACENPECAYAETPVLIYALNFQSALLTANELNREREEFCPLCHCALGFFPFEKQMR